MRLLGILFGLLIAAAIPAATLEKLSFEHMVSKSTEIVRGRATAVRTTARGPVIYTLYRVQVVERWKGPAAAQVEVAVPGGTLNGVRQTFSGAPSIQPGVEYVLFLWTGRNGLTQVIGLSQGKFELAKDSNGDAVLYRGATTERMVDASGRTVEDQPVRMTLKSLDERIRRSMAVAK